MEKTKVVPFNDYPYRDRKIMCYYTEDARAQGMEQVLDLLACDIGANQKRKVRKWIDNIRASLEREYELAEPLYPNSCNPD